MDEGPGPVWHGREDPHAAQGYTPPYEMPELPEASFEPDVPQPPAAHPGTQQPRNPRWSSASLDEVPDARSVGSFASWGRPTVPGNAGGVPTSRTGSASGLGAGSGYGPGSPLARPGSGGGSPRLGSPSVGGRSGGGAAAGTSPLSKLPTVVSEDVGVSEGNVGGGGGGDEEADPEMDPAPGPTANGAANGHTAHSDMYGTYEPAYAAAQEGARHAPVFGSVAEHYDSGAHVDPEGDGAGAGVSAGDSGASAGGWPSDHQSSDPQSADPQSALAMLADQRQQYRSWVGQCAATTLAALTPLAEGGAGGAGGGADGVYPPGSIPADVPGMVAAMDAAGCVREQLLHVKAASEAVREAGRAAATFTALTLPEPEEYGDADSMAAGEAAEAEYVSAAYGVTTAVVAAVTALESLEQLPGGGASLLQEALVDAGPALVGFGQAGGPAAALRRRLKKVGAGLCSRLRKEAAVLLARLHWPPPLASGGGATAGAAAGASAEGAEGLGGGGRGGAGGTHQQAASSAAGAPGAAEAEAEAGGAAFAGFESRPVLARRLVGVLTALTHFQMAVEQRPAFIQLLTAQANPLDADDGDGGAEGAKPLLWATQVLAEPVAAKLRAHFHPAAPTGRLDRPAWLYGTVLDFIRQYGHALSTLDDLLSCLNLKPHYNMPAEFARALQEAVLDMVCKERIPAILNQRSDGAAAATESAEASDAAAGPAEAEGLLLGLMDASAAYDIALLPLLGATGPAAEGEAARAAGLLAAAAAGGPSRRRACDVLDPTAAGTADMHSRYVAVALAAPPAAGSAAAEGGGVEVDAADEGGDGRVVEAEAEAGTSVGLSWGRGGASSQAQSLAAAPPAPLLAAWAAAEGSAALRAIEAVAYDDSSLAPAEEAAARALGATTEEEEVGTAAASAPSSTGGGGLRQRGGAGGGGSRPCTRDTWPPLLATEAAAVLDGLVARSRWLSASPAAQRSFLESSAGPVLGLLRRRLARLVDGAAARGDMLGEEALVKVCAALCAAHALHEHLQSLLLTQLAPLVAALGAAAAAADAAANAIPSGTATPVSSVMGDGAPAGKLGGGGGGGFWSGLLGGGGSRGGSAAGAASPARQALRDGVTALAAGGGAGAASLASVAAAAAGAGGGGAPPPVLGEHVRGFARLHRDGCLKLAREIALGFGRCSVAYRHAIEANPQFPFTPEGEAEAEGGAGGEGDGPAASITPSFAPALLFLQGTLARLSRCCDKATFADVWRGAALSINRFMFNFIATESRFTRPGARQFAADVAGLASLFAPYSRRGAASASASSASLSAAAAASATAGGQHFRELQAAARLLCCSDEEAADIVRRASAAAVAAAQAGAGGQGGATPRKAKTGGPGRPPLPAGGTALASPLGTPTKDGRAANGAPAPHSQQQQQQPHARGDPVRGGMAADPVLSSAGLACLSPLQIMNVIEHRI